jgi:hypothetical protein
MDTATKEQFEQACDSARSENNRLKPCKSCIFANEPCTWCMELKKEIKPWNYGCFRHITNQEALRQIAEEEYRRNIKDMTRRYFDMDIISYLVEAASQSLEKLDAEIVADHEEAMKAADAKANNNEREKKFRKKKDNRNKLLKGFAEMKYHAQNFRSAYDKYVVHFFNSLFEEEEGYNFKEHQKVSCNAGVINLIVREFCDKSLDSSENANAIFNFMSGLKGSGIYDDYHKNKFLIKK